MPVRTIKVRVTGDVAQFQQSMTAVGAQIVKVEKQASSTTKVFHQMRGGMASLAQAAIGQAVPGLSSLSGVLGSFAIGSTATVAVLGGIAAVAGAYRLLTKDARESAEAAREAIDALNKPAAWQELANNIERTARRVDQLRGDISRPPGSGLLGLVRASRAMFQREELRRGEQGLGANIGTMLGEAELMKFDKLIEREKTAKREAEEWARTLAAVRNIVISFPLAKIRNPFLGTGPGTLVQGPNGEFVMSNTPRPLARNVSPILGGSRMTGLPGRPRTAEQLEEETRRLQAAAENMAQSVATAFESWVSGAQKAKDAVRDMVQSILRDLLRLIAQRTIVDPLAGAFFNAIGGSSTAGGGSRAVVVNQSVNFAISAVDGPSVAGMLQQQSGTIAQIVGDAARRSTGFRAQLVRG